MPGFGAIGRFPIGVVTQPGTQVETITVDKWFQRLADPVRALPRSPAAMAPFAFFDPAVFVSFSWFDALAEPVRKRPALPAADVPFHFWQSAPSPFVATGWYTPLSEPVRTRPALNKAEVPFFFWEPRLLPFPNITGILNAIETRDLFFGGGIQFIPPVSGEIGLSEVTVASIGEIGLAESPAPGTVSIFGGSIGVNQV